MQVLKKCMTNRIKVVPIIVLTKVKYNSQLSTLYGTVTFSSSRTNAGLKLFLCYFFSVTFTFCQITHTVTDTVDMMPESLR